MRPTSLLRRLFLNLLTVVLLILGTSIVMPLTAVSLQSLPPHASDLKLYVGDEHSCGVHFDDLVRCWGLNNAGQATTPVDLGTVSLVSAGMFHTCAIKPDNTLYCWGSNVYGEITIPPDLGTVSALSLGSYHTCAAKTDKTVRCWGRNNNNQIDVPLDLGTVNAIGAGYLHTCVIKIDNTVRCWGANNGGQSDAPLDLGTVSAISSGGYHTCAMKPDNTLHCWGSNTYGEITNPPDLGTISMVSTGWNHTCAIKTDNTLRCWGDDNLGQSTVPPDLGTVSMVSTGDLHTCVVKTDNTVRCWGLNTYGQSTVPLSRVTLGLTDSPLSEAGGVATVTVSLSDYSWSNVEVNLTYSGTATGGGVDYQASASSVSFTTADLTDSVSLIGVIDPEEEFDETIIVDIDSVVGGTEDSNQQVTALIQDVSPTETPIATESATAIPTDVLPTPTSTEPAPGTELVANGGFENDLTSWVLKNGTGDKIKCDKPDKPVAYSGSCAFRFKGGAGENSRLQQILDLSAVTFTPGDTLLLRLYINAANPAVTGKVKMMVKYSDDTAKCKISLSLAVTAGYELLDSDCTIESSAISRIKLQVKHQTTGGKMYVDEVSVIHHSVNAANVLPLP